jgi:hypothetical protein
MVVVIAIFALVSGMVAESFSTGARLFSQAELRLDTQASALVTLNNLAAELRATTYQSLTISGPPVLGQVVCAFRKNAVPPLYTDPSGSPFVVYWYDASQQAIGRTEVAYDASYQRLGDGTNVGVNELGPLVTGVTRPHWVAYFVQGLSLTITCGDAITQASSFFPSSTTTIVDPVVTIGLVVGKSKSVDPTQRTETYTTAVGLRNSL